MMPMGGLYCLTIFAHITVMYSPDINMDILSIFFVKVYNYETFSYKLVFIVYNFENNFIKLNFFLGIASIQRFNLNEKSDFYVFRR